MSNISATMYGQLVEEVKDNVDNEPDEEQDN